MADPLIVGSSEPAVGIPWAPRVMLAGRTIRIPVGAPSPGVALEPGAFRLLNSRWSPRDSATYLYLRAPSAPGVHAITTRRGGRTASVEVEVRDLDGFRRIHAHNGAIWPRRWPVGQPWHSTKTRQTFLDFAEPLPPNPELVRWWTDLDVAALGGQLPPAEFPRAHFVNLHQGCPRCGTAVFRHGGFYPWLRRHRPCDFRSTCPSCGSVFPSNNLAVLDFGSGAYPDDGFGYFDASDNVFLFVATYAWEQQHAYITGIQALTRRLRRDGSNALVARRLALMLLRYAAEEVYLAAAPQFRYGVSHALETMWAWGPIDWSSQPDPVTALARKGSLDYSEATPHVGQALAVAYDTVWPALRSDPELVAQAQALGLPIRNGEEAATLVEEMLAVLLQCVLDRAAGANKPSESLAALMIIRALDRPDAQEVVDWLYDEGPDHLRVFTTNNFLPDGFPPEATGDYNGIHTDGLFALEHHMRALRTLHPEIYPERRFPSLTDDPRAARIARVPHEVTMIGKSWFQLGDGDAPGSRAIGIRSDWFATSEDRSARASTEGLTVAETLQLGDDCVHTLLDPRTLAWASEYTGDAVVRQVRDAADRHEHRAIGTTIHDGAGIAILRTGGAPERAAAGIVYGDPPWHRHMDVLDLQLLAFGRPFLVDLGYPRTWATRYDWEANWATHNSVWSVVPDVQGNSLVAGRGRLVRTLLADEVQLLDIEAERWVGEEESGRWSRPGVRFRRLVGLIEVDANGVLLLDFARIRGGAEHWRICRGLEGDFVAENFTLAPRDGTVADPSGRRGEMDRLPHADYRALAYMDEVSAGIAASAWRGSWRSRIEPGVQLDLHQTRVSPGSELLTARATSITGTPAESDYRYRALLWRRTPVSTDEETAIDLVFEPRTGAPVLASATAVPALSGDGSASGVAIETTSGARLAVYWAPAAEPGALTAFADGTELRGALAVIRDHEIQATGAADIRYAGRVTRFPDARQEGRIAELDRRGCTIDVDGIATVRVGDHIIINPTGGGHTYGVAAVAKLDVGRYRLTLDMASVLGRGPVQSVRADAVDVRAELITRTGNLHGKRLIVEETGASAIVIEAANTATDTTTLWLEQSDNHPVRLSGLAPGAWVSVVDYLVGDTIRLERTGAAPA